MLAYRSIYIALTLSLAAAAACGPSQKTQDDIKDIKDIKKPDVPDGPPLETVGLSTSAIDTTADPCVDFYAYACGAWEKATEIPADRARWSRGFSEIQKGNEIEVKRILDDAAKAGNQLGNYYAACMNEEAVEKAGITAIKPWLTKARKARRLSDVTSLVTEIHKHGGSAIFGAGSEQDFLDPTKVILWMSQGGLGLPDRDYYTKTDERSVELRKFYQGHVERMLTLAGQTPKAAKVAAANVLAVETALAKLQKTRVESRDVDKMYNPLDLAGLAKVAPNFPWKKYFTALGRPDINAVTISSPKYFSGFSGLLKSISTTKWSSYLTWHIVRGAASSASKAFVDEAFAMRQKLTGQKQLRPRWKRCVASTTRALGELIGQEYIKTKFPGDSKAAAKATVKAISDAFGREIASYDWMDADTKKKALEKRDMMNNLIGYPDKWKKYDFEVAADSYMANRIAAGKWATAYDMAKVGKPLDKTEWNMPPSMVNAYYHPLRNHMVFPAGILQSPFYSVKASPTVNLGGMGMIVGHELTHGFDDQGSKFAGDGSKKNWWSESTAKNFEGKKQCLIDKYNAYEILPGVNVNGKLTLGENIADLGGVKLAFRAHRKLLEGKPVAKVGGYTPDQQFFLAVGQAWCTESREARARQMAVTDSHSPPKFRVNGSVSSMPEFATAFSCDKGTPMNPETMCSVW